MGKLITELSNASIHDFSVWLTIEYFIDWMFSELVGVGVQWDHSGLLVTYRGIR